MSLVAYNPEVEVVIDEVEKKESVAKGGRPKVDYDMEAHKFIADNHLGDDDKCLLRFYRKKWYRYDGKIYSKVSNSFIEGSIITSLSRRVGTSKNSLENVLCALKGLHLCGMDDDKEEPFNIQTGKELKGYFAFDDGTLINPEKYLGAEAGSHVQPTADIFVTRKLNFLFDEDNNSCPRWNKALYDWLDAEEDRQNLQKYFGYLLIDSLRENKMLCCIGAKGTGKSTAGLVAKGLLGSYADVFAPKDFEKEYKRDKLTNFNLLVMEEVEGLLPESIMKDVTTSGEIDYSLKFQPSITASKKAKIMFSSNELRLKDKSGALLEDRIIILPFDKVQRGTEGQVRDLHEVVLEEEAQAIFNWAMDGLELLKAEGFKETESAKAWKQSFIESNNPALTYCKENFGYSFDSFMTNAVFDRFYKDYCSRCGDRIPESKNDFKTSLIQAVPKVRHNVTKKHLGTTARGYLHIQPTKQIDQI